MGGCLIDRRGLFLLGGGLIYSEDDGIISPLEQRENEVW